MFVQSTLLKMLGINSPLCYDKRLYTFNLSAKEREKQEYYANTETREEVLTINYFLNVIKFN